jgi:bifunctional ADP-heptose synthase (sugar kinase/adenylyltransferase)
MTTLKTRDLDDVFARYGLRDVLGAIESLRGMRVTIVGETIVDEYAYCDAIGKSGKEPMMVTRFVSSEVQGGGVIAIANHVAQFCDEVQVVSALGTVDSREEFVRSCLAPNVECCFVRLDGSPTIVKRRYIDAYSLAKLIGVYQMDQGTIGKDAEASFCDALTSYVSSSDLVIVADYGHGLITRRAVQVLAENAPFLAVNTQLNAANHGYHTLSKYPRADFACLHEGELRMDARDQERELEILVEEAAMRLGSRSFLITLGKRGTLLFDRSGFHSCPALADKVVERVGAGDAVLSVTSPAIAAGVAPELVGLLGNLAGAQAVSVMGNRRSISKPALVERVRDLWSGRPERLSERLPIGERKAVG